jgi:hypothetical protein
MNRPANIEAEYEGLSLGDARLQRRAVGIVQRVISGPAHSFPELLPTSAELEGAYRFFQNDAVSVEDLLKPHVQASLARARRHRVVRIVHDSTSMSFGGSRDGCGTLGGGGSGFWAQIALAVSDGEERAPLGVVGLETKVYPTLEEKEKDFQKRRRRFYREKLKTFPSAPVVWPGLEKWSTIPVRLRSALPGTRVIHLMDREADNFALMSLLKKQKMHFVIRGSSARSVGSASDELVRVEHVLAKAEIVVRRRVRLAARPKEIGDHPQREERDATLSLRAARVTLRSTIGGRLSLNVVEAFERRPPPNEEPINWVLFTTEPIDTAEQVGAVVDHYRARWRIEEYFKALKTGCSIEKRQLTNYEALKRVLALFIPVAWHLMALRTAAHREEPTPAASVLTPLQLTVLRALAAERQVDLSEAPTAREALFAVAALGGHLRRNGDPGWLTLGRGYDKLRSAESIWQVATAHAQSCDQS